MRRRDVFSHFFALCARDDGERRELNYGEEKRGENIKNGETAGGDSAPAIITIARRFLLTLRHRLFLIKNLRAKADRLGNYT